MVPKRTYIIVPCAAVKLETKYKLDLVMQILGKKIPELIVLSGVNCNTVYCAAAILLVGSDRRHVDTGKFCAGSLVLQRGTKPCVSLYPWPNAWRSMLLPSPVS